MEAHLRPWRTGDTPRRRSRTAVITPAQFRRLCLIAADNRSPKRQQILEEIAAGYLQQ